MDFSGKTILIVGAGISGIAAAGLLTGKGAELILYDSNSKGNLSEASVREKLNEDFDGKIVLGDLPKECPDGIDLVILSPGVPKDLPFILELQQKGKKIIGEVELAYYFSKGKIVAVTGTNGKTTTTALTGHIIATHFANTLVVGNIGIPYTEMVCRTDDGAVTVAEMSSFQLDTIETFRPEVSMILNITPDHLDRHHTMENYINAKFNVAVNQNPSDICVLNYEDPILREKAAALHTKIVWFSSKTKLEEGLYYSDGVIYTAHNKISRKILNVEDMNLIGEHNYENVMAAIAAAMYFNIPLEDIRDAVCSFKPVEHRIEYVATKNGVKYYNDSKGTNPDASIKAVKAMSAPTYLIGGGYDKHSEYDEWIESFDGKIKHLVLMGQTREKIADCASRHGFTAYTFVESMEEAVQLCAKMALPGENVLLSPCCASWGMFKNYEERGRIFKDIVNGLETGTK